jgi:hypothetical protein
MKKSSFGEDGLNQGEITGEDNIPLGSYFKSTGTRDFLRSFRGWNIVIPVLNDTSMNKKL